MVRVVNIGSPTCCRLWPNSGSLGYKISHLYKCLAIIYTYMRMGEIVFLVENVGSSITFETGVIVTDFEPKHLLFLDKC